MKSASEYRAELFTLVDAMDDETFETWYGCFCYESRGDLPVIYRDRYNVIKARQVVEAVRYGREETQLKLI